MIFGEHEDSLLDIWYTQTLKLKSVRISRRWHPPLATTWPNLHCRSAREQRVESFPGYSQQRKQNKCTQEYFVHVCYHNRDVINVCMYVCRCWYCLPVGRVTWLCRCWKEIWKSRRPLTCRRFRTYWVFLDRLKTVPGSGYWWRYATVCVYIWWLVVYLMMLVRELFYSRSSVCVYRLQRQPKGRTSRWWFEKAQLGKMTCQKPFITTRRPLDTITL